MNHKLNPFDGKSIYTKFVWAVYVRLISRTWISHADVMAGFMKLKSAKDLPCTVTKFESEGKLNKAFRDIVSLLKNDAVRIILKSMVITTVKKCQHLKC